MTEAQAITLIRRFIREPSPRLFMNEDIQEVMLSGIHLLAAAIHEVDQEFFSRRVALKSNTNVFALPSDWKSVTKAWELPEGPHEITGATNASPIVITDVGHGWSTGQVILSHGVLGNTAANGTWRITVIDVDSYSLDGSTGNAAYTSGGYAFDEASLYTMTKREAFESSNANPDKWYFRGNSIVVDDPSFTSALVIDYIFKPASISDIPDHYHFGLCMYAIAQLCRAPQDSTAAPELARIQAVAEANWNAALATIQTTHDSSSEPAQVRDVWGSGHE